MADRVTAVAHDMNRSLLGAELAPCNGEGGASGLDRLQLVGSGILLPNPAEYTGDRWDATRQWMAQSFGDWHSKLVHTFCKENLRAQKHDLARMGQRRQYCLNASNLCFIGPTVHIVTLVLTCQV